MDLIRNRERCKRYYQAHKKVQQLRCLKNYRKWKSSPNRAKRLQKINKKAKARQRYGTESRVEILKRYNHSCANCNSTKRLMIHHLDNKGRKVDGIEKPNNTPKNLVVLCARCHVLHHTRNMKLNIQVKI